MPKEGLPSLLERHWAESALAIGAVVIAAASLWVAFDSERTNRQLVASASWPFVQFYDTETTEPRELRFIVANDGIGPAKLESFELFWQGHPQPSPWQFLRNCCAQGVNAPGQFGSLAALHHDPGLGTSSDQGIVIRAGEARTILTYTRTAGNSAIWDALDSRFSGNLSVRYCYCSAFNECWLNTARVGAARDLNPPRVGACPRPKTAYDNTSG